MIILNILNILWSISHHTIAHFVVRIKLSYDYVTISYKNHRMSAQTAANVWWCKFLLRKFVYNRSNFNLSSCVFIIFQVTYEACCTYIPMLLEILKNKRNLLTCCFDHNKIFNLYLYSFNMLHFFSSLLDIDSFFKIL